jgi:DNA polymerase V
VNVSGIDSCMPLDIFGHQMRNQVLKNTGLTVGWGLRKRKRWQSLRTMRRRNGAARGVVDLSDRDRQRKLLGAVPVEEVWGLGGGSPKS